MIAGLDNVPQSPLGSGADSLIATAPVYGPIIVALALYGWWITRNLIDSKAAHISDLKASLATVHDLKETLSAATAALSRRSQR